MNTHRWFIRHNAAHCPSWGHGVAGRIARGLRDGERRGLSGSCVNVCRAAEGRKKEMFEGKTNGVMVSPSISSHTPPPRFSICRTTAALLISLCIKAGEGVIQCIPLVIGLIRIWNLKLAKRFNMKFRVQAACSPGSGFCRNALGHARARPHTQRKHRWPSREGIIMETTWLRKRSAQRKWNLSLSSADAGSRRWSELFCVGWSVSEHKQKTPPNTAQ